MWWHQALGFYALRGEATIAVEVVVGKEVVEEEGGRLLLAVRGCCFLVELLRRATKVELLPTPERRGGGGVGNRPRLSISMSILDE
jgi:hypothetical protein